MQFNIIASVPRISWSLSIQFSNKNICYVYRRLNKKYHTNKCYLSTDSGGSGELINENICLTVTPPFLVVSTTNSMQQYKYRRPPILFDMWRKDKSVRNGFLSFLTFLRKFT
jgi:hypothetical protein